MNPFCHSNTQPILRRGIPSVAALAFAFWTIAWHCLNERFSSGGYSDLYQNSAAFAVQSRPLDLKFPLLSEFPPFSEAWGIQWPFYMAVKSFIFEVIPYNLSTIFLLGLAITVITAALGYRSVRQLTENHWLAALASLALLSDRNLMFHVAAGRSEPLVCLLFLCILDRARRIAADQGKGASPGFLLPFLLLPGMHPFGLMVTGGLVLLHLVFFKRLYPNGGRTLRWGPPIAYAGGVGLFLLWFFLQPAAWEQMRINLQVQEAIYQTATRFTFFVPFITELPLGSGYLLWGGALAGGVFVAGSACMVLFGKNTAARLSPDLFLAASIVCSLPVIGLIFRVDNFYHFAVGTSAAVYLIAGLSRHAGRFRKPLVWAASMTLGWAVLASFALPAWKLLQFKKAGYPDLKAERRALVREYADARRIYIPTQIFHEALEISPEKFRFFSFPVPMLKDVRRNYEDHAFRDEQPGDILIVPTEPVPVSDRLLQRPIRNFHPPDPAKWEFVKRHQRELPGTSKWGWDLTVYRHK